jgi:hypothetical protein
VLSHRSGNLLQIGRFHDTVEVARKDQMCRRIPG